MLNDCFCDVFTVFLLQFFAVCELPRGRTRARDVDHGAVSEAEVLNLSPSPSTSLLIFYLFAISLWSISLPFRQCRTQDF